MMAPLGVFFAVIDWRNKKLFDTCYKAGKELETSIGKPGVYTQLIDVAKIADRQTILWNSHTTYITSVYFAGAIIMTALALLFYFDFNRDYFDLFESDKTDLKNRLDMIKLKQLIRSVLTP